MPNAPQGLDGDAMQAIINDIRNERAVEDSKLSYNDAMLEFRAKVEKEWEAWKANHPDAELHVPPELPT